MWVKKSPQELKKDQIKTDWKVAKRTALILIGILVFASIFHTGEEAYKGESFLVSPEDIIGRFLSLAPPFLICAFAIYAFLWISVRIVPLPMDSNSICVCPMCGSEKKFDRRLTCSCGGHSEDIKTMKWIDDKTWALPQILNRGSGQSCLSLHFWSELDWCKVPMLRLHCILIFQPPGNILLCSQFWDLPLEFSCVLPH